MTMLFGLCALLLSSAATASYIESFDVRVNIVDVLVTDARGNRITGLGQDDFVVRQNGTPSQSRTFSSIARTQLHVRQR